MMTLCYNLRYSGRTRAPNLPTLTLISRDEDPDPLIFGLQDPDPLLFSSDPTSNNGYIKLYSS